MCAQQSVKALGIDLGGTNIRAAIVDASGTILARRRIATPDEAGALAPPAQLVAAMRDCAAPLLVEYPDCVALGVGSGGQFNTATGMMRGINTGDPRFVDYPIGTELQAALGLPVCIDNDVKMAAYAELKLGAGRGLQHLICVAVGTGIGGALIVNGDLFQGASGLAGHLGQIPDAQSGTEIEALAGGVPLGRIAQAQGVLSTHETTEVLFAKARAGDAAAAQVIEHAGQALGRVLVGLAHALEPQRILLGGSVGIQPQYLAAINRVLEAQLMPAWRSIRALPMQLGTEAGQIGAGLRAIEELT